MSGLRGLAAVQVGPGAVEVRELEVPPVDAHCGLLEVEACGVCGTDLDQFLDRHHNREYPLVMGHEPVGRIAQLGSVAAQRWGVALGDRVAVEVMLPCGTCRQCRTGHSRTCPWRRANRRAYSTIPLREAPGLWGGFAEYVHLDQSSVLHRVPEHVPAHVAVMFNALANAIDWSLHTPGTRPGDDVVLLGCGQRALLSVIALRAAGAGRIVVTGLGSDAHKLALARDLGADAAIDIESGDVVDTVRELTRGARADVVVDLTPGATDSLGTALELVRDGGTIVLAGMKGGRSSPLDTDRFVTRNLVLRSGLSAGYDAYEQAISLLATRTDSFARLHTHSFPLTKVTDAFRALAGESGQPAVSVSVTVSDPDPH